MKQISILGVGSPFGDDQVGWKVVENLQAGRLNNRVILKKLDRPHLQLVEEIKLDDTVFIIDAMKSNSQLGEIKRLSLNDIANMNQPILSHDVGVISSLQIAAALNELPKQLTLFGIEIDEIRKDDTISDKVLDSISVVTTIIKTEIMKILLL